MPLTLPRVGGQGAVAQRGQRAASRCGWCRRRPADTETTSDPAVAEQGGRDRLPERAPLVRRPPVQGSDRRPDRGWPDRSLAGDDDFGRGRAAGEGVLDRQQVADHGDAGGQASCSPGSASRMPRAGAASASSASAGRPSPQRPAGPPPGARARSRTAGRRAAVRRVPGTGSAARSTQRAQQRQQPRAARSSSRGRPRRPRVIAPTASAVKTSMPVRNRPAREIITVSPDTTMARPEVAAAIRSASAWLRPCGPFLPLPAQVEQRVVDADGHPDQQHHRGRGAR